MIFYVISLTIGALFIILLWWYATRNHRLVDKQLDPALIRHYIQRSLIAPIIFVLSIGLSFISPYLAEGSRLLIDVVIMIHERYYQHHMAIQQRESVSPVTMEVEQEGSLDRKVELDTFSGINSYHLLYFSSLTRNERELPEARPFNPTEQG